MHTYSILTENGIKYKPSEPKVLGGGPKHFDPDGRKDAPGRLQVGPQILGQTVLQTEQLPGQALGVLVRRFVLVQVAA